MPFLIIYKFIFSFAIILHLFNYRFYNLIFLPNWIILPGLFIWSVYTYRPSNMAESIILISTFKCIELKTLRVCVVEGLGIQNINICDHWDNGNFYAVVIWNETLLWLRNIQVFSVKFRSKAYNKVQVLGGGQYNIE
jgi:hypothetical protein